MSRKPLSSEAKAAAIERLHDVMRKACERMERGNVLTGVLLALAQEPREG